MTDIYFKNEVLTEIESDKDLFLSQIQLMFETDTGDVIDDLSFGINLSKFVHEFTPNIAEIKSIVYNAIQKHIPLSQIISYGVDVDFYKGDLFNYLVIDITINNEKEFGFIIK